MKKNLLRSRGIRALVALITMSLIWLVVLPQVGEYAVIRQHIDSMQRSDIDPSAMFYSELKSMSEVEGDFRRLDREHPELLWKP